MAEPDAPAPEYRVGGRTYRCPYALAVRPLTPDEDRALRADIAARGVVTPVVVTPDGEVLDGVNRLRVAADLDLDAVPVRVVDVPADARRATAVALNVHRRQLSRAERRALVAASLAADPGRSNTAVAASAGVSDKTVAAVRREKEATSEIPTLDATVGRDGRRRKARRTAAPGAAPGGEPAAGVATPADAADEPQTPDPRPDPGAVAAPGTQPSDPFGLYSAGATPGARPAPVVSPAGARTGGKPAKPLAWWPRLKEHVPALDAATREVARLARLRAADRSAGAVADLARRVRVVADDLDRLAATDPAR